MFIQLTLRGDRKIEDRRILVNLDTVDTIMTGYTGNYKVDNKDKTYVVEDTFTLISFAGSDNQIQVEESLGQIKTFLCDKGIMK